MPDVFKKNSDDFKNRKSVKTENIIKGILRLFRNEIKNKFKTKF